MPPFLAEKSMRVALCTTTCPPEPPPPAEPTRSTKFVLSPPPPKPPLTTTWPCLPKMIGPIASIVNEPAPPPAPPAFSSPVFLNCVFGKQVVWSTSEASPPPPPPEPAQTRGSSPMMTVPVFGSTSCPKKSLVGSPSLKGEGAGAPPIGGPWPHGCRAPKAIGPPTKPVSAFRPIRRSSVMPPRIWSAPSVPPPPPPPRRRFLPAAVFQPHSPPRPPPSGMLNAA